MPVVTAEVRPVDRTRPVLAEIHRRYGHLLAEPAGARFFEVDSPSDMWAWFPAEARARWLGYTLGPRRKLDGPRPEGAPAAIEEGEAPQGAPAGADDDEDEEWAADWEDDGPMWGARALDGAWDFRAEFGLLYVCSPGHGVLESEHGRVECVEAVLGGWNADVAGLERWLRAESRRRAAAARRVVGLGGTDDILGLRVEPEGVILPDGLLAGLLRDVDLFCSGREWYAQHRVPWRRGLLLYGPPGNGKTTVARALASRALDLGGAAFAFTPARHQDRDVRAAFRRATAAAPAVLLMEDVDAVRESEITRAVFLSLIEDPARARGVYLVATTNYPDEVDPALAGRAGRFDRAVHLPNPEVGLRRRFLRRLWVEEPLAGLVDEMAEATEGLSLASLNEVHYAAAMRLREGLGVEGEALASVAASLRRVETAKVTRSWGRGPVGFKAGR